MPCTAAALQQGTFTIYNAGINLTYHCCRFCPVCIDSIRAHTLVDILCGSTARDDKYLCVYWDMLSCWVPLCHQLQGELY